jgi:pyridoxine/pyridoxamine 5'-phosphate oxidase
LNEKKQLIAETLRRHELAVVSSIWEGKPQAAVVVFSIKDDFELIFGTFNTTRKYRNLKANPNTAIVVGWDEGITIQYEGVAEEVALGEFAEYQKIHLAKNPGSEKYANLDGQVYFKIKPRWIRYTDINQNPEFLFEEAF